MASFVCYGDPAISLLDGGYQTNCERAQRLLANSPRGSDPRDSGGTRAGEQHSVSYIQVLGNIQYLGTGTGSHEF